MTYKIIYENSIQIVDNDGILLIDIFKNSMGTFTIDTVGEVCIDLDKQSARKLIDLLIKEIED
jgi:hypothetical protein